MTRPARTRLAVEPLEDRAVPAADAFEPNNTRETATPIAEGTPITGLTIDPTADVDYFTFTLGEPATNRGTFSVVAQAGTGDLDVVVENASGGGVRFGTTGSPSERVSLSGLPAGTYYARVYGYFGATGGYSVRLDPPPPPDAFEPNNTRETATPLAANATLTGLSVAPATDVDYFSFTLTQPATSRDHISVVGDPGLVHLDVRVEDANGTTLRYGDTVTYGERWVNLGGLAAGTYFLRVKEYYETTTGGYSVRLDLPPPPPPDAYEPNNGQENGTPIEPGSTTTGLSIHSGADVDWFTLTLDQPGTAANYVGLNFDNSTSYLDSFDVQLVNAAGQVVRSASVGYTRTPRLSLNGLPAGTYGLTVYSLYGGLGDYSVLYDAAIRYTVVNTDDAGPGSLRDAIGVLAGDPTFFTTGVPPTIDFAIPGPGPHVITPQTALPTFFRPMAIDATTQPGYDGTPLVTLDGSAAGDKANGLAFSTSSAAASQVEGLSVVRFGQAGVVVLSGSVTVSASYLGVTPAGAAAGNRSGVVVAGGFSGSTNRVLVGGADPSADGNVIAGNAEYGVVVYGSAAPQTVVQNNLIGTNPAGTAAVPNGWSGVTVDVAASGHSVVGNVISGNLWGVVVRGAGTNNNLIAGNRIGTNAAGTAAVPNTYAGVLIQDGPRRTTVGGASGNQIAGNLHGVALINAAETTIAGNYVGTDLSGTAAIPNALAGVVVTSGGAAAGSSDNLVTGNILSGNGADGAWVYGPNVVRNGFTGNYVGLGATGAALPNANNGVWVGSGATRNTFGGPTVAAANYLSGNGVRGIALAGPASVAANELRNNYIGVGVNGAARGNGGPGVLLDGVGVRDTLVSGNAVAFNAGAGIAVTTGAAENVFTANSIHDNGLLGIDLGDDGVTANDADATSDGPNRFQNAPTIDGVSLQGPAATITGSITTRPNTAVRVEVFASESADPSGSGEGATFLGGVTVTTDGTGVATFSLTVAYSEGVGGVFTATATAPFAAGRNTSEFSPAFVVLIPL